jgi:glucose/arabinose dehydrogenase
MQDLLAVAALKGAKLLLMRVEPDGTVAEVGQLPQLDGRYGRLRSVRMGNDGALYVTTSNGDDDKVLRVAPAGT